MFGILGMDAMPIIYGIIIFLGLASIWWKLTHGKYIGALIEIVVFILVFKLHGGTMNGGFAAAIAALLAGNIFPWMMRKRKHTT